MKKKSKTITVDELEGFDKTVVGMCESFWEDQPPDDDALPHFIMEDAFGGIHVAMIDPAFMATEQEKNKLAHMMSMMILGKLGVRCAFMCAAWTATAIEGDDTMPRDRPDREETAFVSVMEPGGVDRFYSSRILRKPNKPPRLKGWTLADGGAGGRFHDAWCHALDTAAVMYEAGRKVFGEGEEADARIKRGVERAVGKLPAMSL